MYCPSCGSEIQGDNKFCPQCGEKIPEQGGSEPTSKSEGESIDSTDDEESVSDKKKGGINITLGKVIAYPVGAILVLIGLSMLAIGEFLPGVLYLLGGIVSLPIARAKLKDRQGIRLSRWVTVLVVLILVSAGSAAIDDVESPEPTPNGDPEIGATDGSDESGNGQSNLIEGPPESLLPTIDDFESGWQQSGNSDNPGTRTFYNVESDSVLIYNVTIHDSIESARTDIQTRRNEIRDEGIATDDTSVGEDGFLYKFDRGYVLIEFRVMNVVAKTEYDAGAGVLTPENNAVRLARELEDAISESG